MDNVIRDKTVFGSIRAKEQRGGLLTNLSEASMNEEYVITGIDTQDESMRVFLFTLGCYEGEMITMISKLCDNYIIAVNGSRYSIDENLARAILI